MATVVVSSFGASLAGCTDKMPNRGNPSQQSNSTQPKLVLGCKTNLDSALVILGDLMVDTSGPLTHMMRGSKDGRPASRQDSQAPVCQARTLADILNVMVNEAQCHAWRGVKHSKAVLCQPKQWPDGSILISCLGGKATPGGMREAWETNALAVIPDVKVYDRTWREA